MKYIFIDLNNNGNKRKDDRNQRSKTCAILYKNNFNNEIYKSTYTIKFRNITNWTFRLGPSVKV